MTRFCFRTALRLMALFSIAVATILAVPYRDSQLQTFVTAPDICEGECLLGIHAGFTTVGEAMAYLQAHSWVERTQLSAAGAGFGQIRWWWSGRQPDFIDDRHPGRITFYWDNEENGGQKLDDTKVETIAIYTRIRMPSLQKQFGAPDSGTAVIRLDGSLGYSAAYPVRGGTLSLSTVLSCPASLLSYWNAGTKVTLSIGYGTSQYVPPAEMVKIC